MRCGLIDFYATYQPGDYVLMGLRLLRQGQMVWEMPAIKWQLPPGAFYTIATANEVEADKLVVRLGHANVPNVLKIYNSAEDRELATEVYMTPWLPTQTSETLQDFAYDLPASSPTPPSGGGEPPGSPVLLGGLSLDATQVAAGGKVGIGVQVQVNSTFQGKINVSLLASPPVGPVSTGLRDFLAGSYSMPLDMTIPVSAPPGTYPLYTEVLDAGNNRLVYFTTEPILTVLPAPPPPPPSPGVVINSLTVTPTQARPGDKLAVAAQVTVSAAFKGLMSFALFGNSTTIGVKDWAQGSYPVPMEVTVPQDAQSGTYRGIWLAVDTVAGKQLASKDVQVEVVAGSPPVSPPPDAVSPGWLTPLMDLAAVGVVFGGVKGMNKLVQKLR